MERSGCCVVGALPIQGFALATSRPQAGHLHDQSLFPNGIVAAPAGEVQGSLAMKHAVLHFPDIFCFGREDVFSFALHPARTKGNQWPSQSS